MQWLGRIALFSVLLLTLLAFQGLVGFSGQGPDWSLLEDPYLHAVLGFSLKQATLSALLSVLLAWPIARALYYLPALKGSRYFLSLCLLSFVLPTLVLITGLVALLGRSGLLTPWLSALLGEWNLYGLNGILIAHVYLNMPFAVRVMLLLLQGLPDTSWRLARQLNLNARQRFWYVELPALRNGVLMLFGFIWVLCFNSFAVVLALGGGPKATTLEVAIYQALKYDFNIPEALTLAWLQLAIAGSLFLLLSRFGSLNWLAADTASSLFRPRPTGWRRSLLSLPYYLAWPLLLLPMLALLPGITPNVLERFSWSAILQPTAISLLLGFGAAALAILLAYLMLMPIRRCRILNQPRRRLALEWIATHSLVAPAMVLSVGLFIYFLPLLDLDTWGVLFVVSLNMAVVVPFAIQQLKPRLFQFDQQYHRLAASLQLRGLALWRIEWPFVRPVFLASLALILVLAIGDVAIFSIFGNEQWTTLPWLIYGYASTYRIGEASLASLLLLLICALIISFFELERAQQQGAKRSDNLRADKPRDHHQDHRQNHQPNGNPHADHRSPADPS